MAWKRIDRVVERIVDRLELKRLDGAGSHTTLHAQPTADQGEKRPAAMENERARPAQAARSSALGEKAQPTPQKRRVLKLLSNDRCERAQTQSKASPRLGARSHLQLVGGWDHHPTSLSVAGDWRSELASTGTKVSTGGD